MAPNLLFRNASMILAIMAATPLVLAKTHAGEVRITVRVHDYVKLPAEALSEIEANAKRVLGQAGVPVEFVECYHRGVETGVPACTGPLGPADLILRILEPKLAVNGEQLGFAAMTPEGGAYITVFINPAQRKARIGSLSDGSFLGHAVSHEIGHLLLGPNSHSSSGVMRSLWRPCDEEWMAKGALLFTNAQAKQMRLTLTERSSR
jgi:hypothetical protein